MQDENGHYSFIPIAASKAKDTIIPDKDLIWMEFNEAAPCILKVIEASDWYNEQIQSHLQF
ncbi:hypothetical protein J3R82DRAFT_2298 [Butyriboletus roseoflavus]|nr:hypothetical protein J3R82DRAFT_2298 [Butyriboletus roseoflavus]